ncbi:MAG TPA: AmmeMemoRadiSam system protein A, partial [Pyrinomonadaceae bacterium]|nr:AmmeMemoRadiSam system protein A [Pyrinomonadaceae bacterium]
MSTHSIVFAGIVPHPPIMVPEVGRDAASEVRGSIDAMRDFTERLIKSGAETVVMISPHAPLDARAFVTYQDSTLYGDFANFRAPETKVEAPLDEELLQAIARAAAEQGYEVIGIKGYELDHGTAVPLYFLQRNGWRGRVVALGYNFLPNEDHLRFGSCIRRAVEATNRPAALVASGDLSHRLKPEAPAGYQPQAHLFDEEVVASLHDCQPERIVNIDQNLRKLAGECGYRSMLVAFGATSGLKANCDVLHYEAPFGVGYMVAQLVQAHGSDEEAEASSERITEANQEDSSKQEAAHSDGEELPAVARSAVETFVHEGTIIKPPSASSQLLNQCAACFVSLKTLSGELRGCIGTIEPVKKTLAEELIANAVSAATRDPRFAPVAASELSNLRYSVDVLYAPEPAEFEDLDPAVYGVIVEDEEGRRRGLLLPDIQGVETARQQVDIAARKAGIVPGTPLKLSRFRVERYRESARPLTTLESRSTHNGR